MTKKKTDFSHFEQSIAELEQIVQQLEQGDLSLDQALQQFERGIELSRYQSAAVTGSTTKSPVISPGRRARSAGTFCDQRR